MNFLGMHGAYFLFSGCCLLGFIFIYFCVPETKGKTLDEIQLFFKPRLEVETNSKEEDSQSQATKV